MKYKLFFLLFIFISVHSYAQQVDCACCSPEHQQFDFWIGDWEVFNTEGDKIGENLVKKLEDNCIINENWIGEKGGSGKSYNYYDPTDKTWNQLWISNTGNILKLKGKAKINSMILKSEPTQGEKGTYYNQITWIKNADGTVTQNWEIYDLQGNFLDNSFQGIYRRKK